MPEPSTLTSRSRIIADILRYIIKHPEAKDSTDGIKRWWLSTGGVSPADRDVREALAFVVANGWLEVRQVTRQHRIFAARAGSMRGAAEFLRHLVEHADGHQE